MDSENEKDEGQLLEKEVNRLLEPTVTLEEESETAEEVRKKSVTFNLEKKKAKKDRKSSKEEDKAVDKVLTSMRGRKLKKTNFLDL